MADSFGNRICNRRDRHACKRMADQHRMGDVVICEHSQHVFDERVQVQFTSRDSRCDRSPSPVFVMENTRWPADCSFGSTLRQTQAPQNAPGTRTYVFFSGLGACADALVTCNPKASSAEPVRSCRLSISAPPHD